MEHSIRIGPMLIETGVKQALFARSLTAKRHGSVASAPLNPETLENGSERTLFLEHETWCQSCWLDLDLQLQDEGDETGET